MQYTELLHIVKQHAHLYYDLSEPNISDEEYDALYDQLLKMEKAQGWSAIDSPTNRVGNSSAGKLQHPKKLYSLNKVYDAAEVDPAFTICTPKIDGACLALYYDATGQLSKMVTRGNGEFGEDVTRFKDVILGVPQFIEEPNCIVVGECVTQLTDVKNYRNFVSGALGLDDPKEFAERLIGFVAHDELTLRADYVPRMEYLYHEDFNTVLSIENNQYPTDGLVYRINDWQRCQELGYTSKHPRFAVALKPRGKSVAATTLQDVIWVVGRTGTVNPVGIVTPVELDDATVSRVTLHNMGFIESHRLGLGDVIEIERAGGIIPKFIRVLQEKSHNNKIEQKHAELAIGLATRRDGPRLVVADKSQASTTKLLEHFVKTMEIKGLGPASIAKMGLMHPVDIYNTTGWTTVLGVNGEKIIAEIERSSTKPYYVVLAALGIPGVGKAVARLVCNRIPRFDMLRDVETVHIAGVGPKTIENILAWLDVNEDWVSTLPLKLEQDQSILDVESNSDNVKKICITGKLDMSRSDLTDILEQFGFQVVTSVTRDCYALISAEKESGSAKMKAAIKNNVKIVDYWSNKKEILNGQV